MPSPTNARTVQAATSGRWRRAAKRAVHAASAAVSQTRNDQAKIGPAWRAVRTPTRPRTNISKMAVDRAVSHWDRRVSRTMTVRQIPGAAAAAARTTTAARSSPRKTPAVHRRGGGTSMTSRRLPRIITMARPSSTRSTTSVANGIQKPSDQWRATTYTRTISPARSGSTLLAM